jgi:3-oxoisoapionate decarboxylase
MNRRHFLKIASGTALAAVTSPAIAETAADPSSGKNVRLGIDCYSLRDFHWKARQLLDYAAGLELDAIQANFGDFESLEDEHLREVRQYAQQVGVAIELGANSVCPLSPRWNAARQGEPKEYLSKCIRMAGALGTKTIKCYMGNMADRRGHAPIPQLMDVTVNTLRLVREQAIDAGVKFALENHGDLLAREARTVIKDAGPEFVGCCLDSGNPMMLAEDPLLTLEVLGPYTVTSHIRDSVVYEHPRGAAVQWVALGDGCIDLKAFVARFQELCPHAPLLLEILTGTAPVVLNYLEPEFWKAFPNVPAADFARFVALAKKGRPFTGGMMIARGRNQPPEYMAALKEQQRFDLERSLEYAKKTLGVGVRWQAGHAAQGEPACG